MLTDSTREYLRRIVGLYDKKKKKIIIIIMSFATVLCLIPENVYGCLYIITGNGLAAGCQLFYHKIYGQFYSVEISLVLLLNKMIDSLFMYL